MLEVLWIPDYLEDLDADFRALYGIDDPWLMPAWQFCNLAMRVFFYQGAMTFRATEQSEEAQPGVGRQAMDTLGSGQQVNHNTAAAKAAARAAGLKGDQEVQMVPLSSLMGAAGGLGSFSQVKA
jgi:hypothetical protein